MKFTGKLTTLLLLSACSLQICGAQRRTFAIVIDSESLSACSQEVEAYRSAVSDEGPLGVVLSADWDSPEQVRDSLLHYYRNASLEGAVFIGDIPIPMIRKAQHLTSAFKMSEKHPMRDSSVPSDRFYDDFDLKFDFVCRDSIQTELFYYELSPGSPQNITSDIYTGRIKPSGKYTDKNSELKAYLRKAVEYKLLLRTRPEDCIADRLCSYTGDGSFSNSLIAWKDETITLAEQFPQADPSADGMRFYLFAMQPYMKETMLAEIAREDLDIVLFHEHGMPERQYLTGTPPAEDLDGYYNTGRYLARAAVRTRLRYGDSPEEAMASVMERYGLDSSWVCDSFDPEVVKADSLEDLRTGIVLDDIQKTAPNVRLAIFDACYNGDFREEDCVASRYVMSPGKSIAAVGNSVNVLQDKSSSDLLGMLGCGYCVGEWLRQVNILESHILGDPTFRFARSCEAELPDTHNGDIEYWKRLAGAGNCPDIRGLALHRLFDLEYADMAELLLDTYKSSDSYMLRLQCMHLLAHYPTEAYMQLLTLSANDPYEFIRRKTAHYLGKVGTPEAARVLAGMYLRDRNAKRVFFNITMAASHFPEGMFLEALHDAAEESVDEEGREALLSQAAKEIASHVSMMKSTAALLAENPVKVGRNGFYISGMRNNPYPVLAPGLLKIVCNPAAETALRVQATEVLGWFVRAFNRGEIAATLDGLKASEKDMPTELKNEITRTVGRLSDYLRK